MIWRREKYLAQAGIRTPICPVPSLVAIPITVPFRFLIYTRINKYIYIYKEPEYIYIYIYVERERERSVCVCI